MQKKIEKAIELAKRLNTIENINKLNIPILDGFEVIDTPPNNKILFVAKKDNMIEQLLTDGALIDDEKIDERIDKILLEITKEIEGKPLYKKGVALKFLKQYHNGEFVFHIYVQDILTGTPSNKKLTRQLNAYFVEPRGKEFCQLSLAAGLYQVGDRYKVLGDIKNLNDDELVKALEVGMDLILNNIKYKEK